MNFKLAMLVPILLVVAQCGSKGGDGGSGNGGLGGITNPTKGGVIGSAINLKGTWKGSGQFKFNETNGPCENVEFKFTQTETKIRVEKGVYQCGQQSNEWAVVEVDINGDNLLLGSQKIGTLSSEHIIIEESSEGNTSKITMRRKAGTRTLAVTEQYVFPQGKLDFSATLNLQ